MPRQYRQYTVDNMFTASSRRCNETDMFTGKGGLIGTCLLATMFMVYRGL